jgi:hypothetical protein
MAVVHGRRRCALWADGWWRVCWPCLSTNHCTECFGAIFVRSLLVQVVWLLCHVPTIAAVTEQGSFLQSLLATEWCIVCTMCLCPVQTDGACQKL